MKEIHFSIPQFSMKALAIAASLTLLSACGDSDKPAAAPTGKAAPVDAAPVDAEKAKSAANATLKRVETLARKLDQDSYLPFIFLFKSDGTPEIKTFSSDTWSAKVVDVSPDEFPIPAKIKRIDSITLVTYEGSCVIMTPTPAGYKKIVIQDDKICAKIKP